MNTGMILLSKEPWTYHLKILGLLSFYVSCQECSYFSYSSNMAADKGFLIRSLPSLWLIFFESLPFLLQIWSLRDGDETWQNHTRLPKTSPCAPPSPTASPSLSSYETCLSKPLTKGKTVRSFCHVQTDIWLTLPLSHLGLNVPTRAGLMSGIFRIRVLPSFPNFVTVDEELRNSDRWMERTL